jgi:pimeloyl-ACP methyl ester carboxylesterase
VPALAESGYSRLSLLNRWMLAVLLFLFLFGFILKAQQPPLTSHVIQRTQLTSVACAFSLPDDDIVECAELRLPDTAGGFVLPITTIKTNSSAQSMPLLYFNGGPGAGVSVDADTIYDWLGWYQQAGLKRDLVLFDRRATGFSSPKKQCLAYDRFSLLALKKNLSTQAELQLGQPVVAQCFRTLERKGFSAQDFGTEISSRDAFQIMTALGYDAWHVFGVSYGSRLALVHAANYPAQVKALVLDSVYPPGEGVLAQWPDILNAALQGYFDYCDGLIECRHQHGGISTEVVFWRAMHKLKVNSQFMQLNNWRGGEIDIQINDHRLLAAVFSALYDVNSIKKIAPALQSVLKGNGSKLKQLLTPFVNYALDESFNAWVYLSIECRENTAIIGTELLNAVDLYPRLQPYLAGMYQLDSCQQLLGEGAFQKNKLPANITATLNKKKVLLLAGELDPITPVVWAERLAKQLGEAHLWQIPEVGHAVLANNHCVHSQLEGYLSGGANWQPKLLCLGEFK